MLHVCLLLFFYFRLQLPLIIIHITCISISLRWTSAPIQLTSVLSVLGTQDTSCIVIAGLLERDIFDLYLPGFDKPWVIHLRETCYCSTNLSSWSPNTIYRNRSVRRHQPAQNPFQNCKYPKHCFLSIRGYPWHKNEIKMIRRGYYSSNNFQDSTKQK
jgi:hypothetical protein